VKVNSFKLWEIPYLEDFYISIQP